MCKKLMFLISLVCLLGLTGTAFSEDCGDGPEYCVESGDSVTISGNVTVDKGFYIGEGGTLTITGTLTCLGDDYRPTVNGGTLIVDGGTLNLPVRMNLGQEDGAIVYIINGGTIHQWDGGGKDSDEGIKFPDDEGGVCRIYVLDGTLEAVLIEWKGGENAQFVVGCNGTITVGETDDDNQDPQKWYDEGDLNCDPNCAGGLLTITDLGGDVKEVICLLLGPEAWKPNPKDGATGEAAVDCDMVLSWRIGNCIIDTKGRNFVYFSTDENCVETAPAIIRLSPAPGDPPCYVARVNVIDLDPLPPVDLQQTYTWNAGSLPLWTKYYWRVDQGCSDASVVKGNIWSFTTGCPLIPGDANLDCIVNFLDYAEVAGTWMGQQYFPDGCTP